MKRYIYIFISILVLTSILVGCSKGDDPTNETQHEETVILEATVIDGENGLLVTPVEGSSELNSSDKIMVHLSSEEGEEQDSSEEEFKPGDLIKVTYDGRIAESYPAQIWASKVELLGRNLLIDGYKAMIDDIYLEDPALNDGIKMIALDTSEWIALSNAEKEALFNGLKGSYDMEIIEATHEELKEMDLLDEEGLYFKEGILIKIEDMEYDKDSYELEADISKWRSGDGAIGWTATASYKGGQWKINRDDYWIS